MMNVTCSDVRLSNDARGCKLVTWIAVALCWSVLTACAESPAPKEDGKKVSILFVGHSFFHGFPGSSKALFASGGWTVENRFVLGGFASVPESTDDGWLKGRADMETQLADKRKRLDTALTDRAWDYLVLIGEAYRPYKDTVDDNYENARKLMAYAKSRNPNMKVVFFQNHASATDFLDRQPAYSAFYRQLARKTGAILAPAGEAWRLAVEQRPDLLLHVGYNAVNGRPDDHPGKNGMYLSMCAIYTAITGTPPRQMPLEIVT